MGLQECMGLAGLDKRRVDVLLKRWIGRRAIVCRVVPFDALMNGFVWGESLVIRIWLLRLLRFLG